MRPAHVMIALLALALALTGAAPPPHSHCGGRAKVTPIEGQPGFFWIETPGGKRLARHPDPAGSLGTPDYIIDALDITWDSDGNSATEVDTLVVPVGSTVRWHLVTGIHTLTNGRDDLDPEAGTQFDFLLNEAHPDFDSTFVAPDTLDYFCLFHLPSMVGTLIIRDGSTPAKAVTWGALRERYRK